MSEIFEAGAAAGKDIATTAVDCPYPPTDKSGRRENWLAGFGSTRGDASPASDPARTADARQPAEPAVAQHPALHEG